VAGNGKIISTLILEYMLNDYIIIFYQLYHKSNW
jgi:hypothetical protein